MITGRDLARRAFAEAAVQCFRRQSYSERELVIVNDGISLFPADVPSNVREVRVAFSKERTLGDLRNIGLEHAKGELVIQWDDDDWHHPTRIEVQAKQWKPGAAVLLRRQFRYSLPSAKVLIFDAPTGIDGTILHERIPSARYPSLRKAEDTLFLKNFATRIVVDAPPSLYLRLYHGNNTWDEAHIMGQRTVVPHWFRPVTEIQDKQFLQSVLTKDYRALFS